MELVTTAPAVLRDLVALTKPRLSALVLLTTAGGIWLAPGRLDGLRAALTIVATALVVAGAQALNCYLEREVDARMERTRHRPLPAGRLEPRTALALGIALPAVGLPPLFGLVNPLTGMLAVVALLSYVLVYTPMKMHSPLALFVGAVPGAIPPLLGFTAVTGRIELAGVVLFSILFLWQLPHFLAIALYFKDDYARGGVAVMPLALRDGERWSKAMIVLFSVALVPVTLLLVPLGLCGRAYLGAAAVLGALLVAGGLSGLRRAAGAAWAGRLFAGTILYLSLLFVALALDAR
ncbi:MAG TPA: heme o synthase [Myxococcota bacterium]|jgi:protoheme IX farnesyltransferase|nr:heme o synthase [Myxococcota bacterium]